MTDIFVIQEEIANAIVDALRDELGPARATASTVTVRADTKNVKAYELYLKARELFIARKDLAESIRLLEKVTQMDPQFARGWELLAAVSSVAPSWDVKDRDYYAMAQVAARRALELDPALSMPWAALATAAGASMPVDWAANFELLDRAIAADARNSSAFLWRGINWIYLGFFERALADFDRCLELEPNYQNALRHKALALLWSGKTDQAFDLFERGVAQGFVNSRAENFVGPLVARGNLLAAQLLLQIMGFSPQARGILIESLRTPGPLRKDYATTIQDYLANPDNAGLRSISASHPFLWLGDFDKVGETTTRQLGTRQLGAVSTRVPQFAGIQAETGEARCAGLLARARVSAAVPCRRRQGFHVRLSRALSGDLMRKGDVTMDRRATPAWLALVFVALGVPAHAGPAPESFGAVRHRRDDTALRHADRRPLGLSETRRGDPHRERPHRRRGRVHARCAGR